jgi:hypothetical protein
MSFQPKTAKSLKITAIVAAIIVIGMLLGVLALTLLIETTQTNTTLSSTTPSTPFSDNLKGWTQYMADPQKQGGNTAGLGQTHWKKYGSYSYPTEPDCSPSLAGINSSAAVK